MVREAPNTGIWAFIPETVGYMSAAGAGLSQTLVEHDAWKWFQGGLIQVQVSESYREDRGDGYSLYLTLP